MLVDLPDTQTHRPQTQANEYSGIDSTSQTKAKSDQANTGQAKSSQVKQMFDRMQLIAVIYI